MFLFFLPSARGGCSELYEKWHQRFGQSTEGLGVVRLPLLSKVKSRVTGGQHLANVLEEFKIPEDMRRFYAPDGSFVYTRSNPFSLGLENGQEPISKVFIKLGENKNPSARDIVERLDYYLLRDWLNALHREPRMKLEVVLDPSEKNAKYAPTLAKIFNDELLKLSPQERSRVSLRILDEAADAQWAHDIAKPLGNGRLVGGREDRYKDFSKIGRLEHSALYFTPGDLIVGQKHIFIGYSTIAENCKKLGISEDEAVQAFSAEFGKKVFVVKANRGIEEDKEVLFQPAFHIDLSMAVVNNRHDGKDVILLESPRLMTKLLKDLPEKHRIAIADGRRPGLKKHTYFTEPEWDEDDFGIPKLTESIEMTRYHQTHLYIDTHNLVGSFLRSDDPTLVTLNSMLDEIGQSLEAEGYTVIRVPGLTSPDFGSRRIINWTNSIFSGNQAYIPRLGYPVLDQSFQNAVRNLGYKTQDVKSPNCYLSQAGGLRCRSLVFRETSAP